MPPERLAPTYPGLKRPAIFAHRGSKVYAPENTLAAFKLAIEHNADGIEFDAKLSKDGQVVIIHDDTVDRTTDGSGRVNSLTLDELKSLDAGSKFNPDFGSEKIPTLDEVFEAVGGKIFINVELTNYSTPTDELPEKVVALVKKHGLEENVLFSSFHMTPLIRARHLLPQVPLGVLTDIGFGESMLATRVVNFGPDVAWHPALTDANLELIQAAHQRNSRVHVYTVNQPYFMQVLFSYGVDGIFTDDPPLAFKVFAEVNSASP